MGGCNNNRYAFSEKCRKAVTTLFDGTVFYVEDSRGQAKIAWSVLSQLIQSAARSATPNRVYLTGTSQATNTLSGSEDEVYCSLDTTVYLPAISDGVKSPYLNADGGTITITPVVGNTIQAGYSTVVDGSAVKLGANVAKSEWRAL